MGWRGAGRLLSSEMESNANRKLSIVRRCLRINNCQEGLKWSGIYGYMQRGLLFRGGVYDLRALEVIISNYRVILDRLVAIQLGKRQVPKDLKGQLGYQVQINSGSIELLVRFLLEHKELLAVFAADGGHTLSKIIVELLRDAIDLRKKASELIKKGLPINITISNSRP